MAEEETSDSFGIYISDIARGTTDEELREAFQHQGRIKSAVVVKNKFTGETKGYGFVEFYSKESVDACLKMPSPSFCDAETGDMRPAKVARATPNNETFISNLPLELSEDEIFELLQSEAKEANLKLQRFVLSMSMDGKSEGRGWATWRGGHRAALSAVKLFTSVLVAGRFLRISFSETPGQADDVRILFVSGLNAKIGPTDLKELFGDGVVKVVRPKDTVSRAPLGHAFVHFEDRAMANEAMLMHNGTEFKESTLRIQWCQPKSHNHPGNRRQRKGTPSANNTGAHLPRGRTRSSTYPRRRSRPATAHQPMPFGVVPSIGNLVYPPCYPPGVYWSATDVPYAPAPAPIYGAYPAAFPMGVLPYISSPYTTNGPSAHMPTNVYANLLATYGQPIIPPPALRMHGRTMEYTPYHSNAPPLSSIPPSSSEVDPKAMSKEDAVKQATSSFSAAISSSDGKKKVVNSNTALGTPTTGGRSPERVAS